MFSGKWDSRPNVSLSCALIGPQGSNHALDVLLRNLGGDKMAGVKHCPHVQNIRRWESVYL